MKLPIDAYLCLPAIANGRWTRSRWIRISLMLYAISFVLPVAADNGKLLWGWLAFLLALLGLFIQLPMAIGGANPDFPQVASQALIGVAFCSIWLANPLYWWTLISISKGRRKTALLAGILAIMLASMFLPRFHKFLPCPGYFVWWLSILLSVISAFRISADDGV